jgi:hypothetical protein
LEFLLFRGKQFMTNHTNLPPAETADRSQENPGRLPDEKIRRGIFPRKDPQMQPLRLSCACGSTTFELRGQDSGTAVCSCCHQVTRISWRHKS